MPGSESESVGKTEASTVKHVSVAELLRKSYKNEREQLDEAIKHSAYIGMSIVDFYRCSNREFTMYQFGAMKRFEEQINSDYATAKWQAAEISLAVWGDKRFAREKVPNVDLTSHILPDSNSKRIASAQKATLERINKQYGVDLEKWRAEHGSV